MYRKAAARGDGPTWTSTQLIDQLEPLIVISVETDAIAIAAEDYWVPSNV